MVAKQKPGLYSPDGSMYICLTDGAGLLKPSLAAKQKAGLYAPDGALYICLTDGVNNLV